MSLPRGFVIERCNPHLFRGVPKCPECDAPAVRLGDHWVCKACVKFGEKEIPVGELFPNRAARRAAVGRRRR